MSQFHIAQVNIGRIRAELNDPIMSGFVERLEEINSLADSAPGFVWRLQTSEGNATYLRPFADERTLLNMSVWETVESLRHFVFKTHMSSCCASVTHGLKSSRGLILRCGGCRLDTFPVSMKRSSVSRISIGTVPRSLRLRSTLSFSPMRHFSSGIDWSMH